MRMARLLAVLIGVTGCNRLFPKYSQDVNPAISASRFHTVAVIAGGDHNNDFFIADRARDKLRKAKVVSIVEVAGLWDNDADVAQALCSPKQTPPVDGFVVTQGDHLTLWDCTSRKVAFDANGAYKGIDYMVKRLVQYLKKGRASAARPSAS